VQTLPQAKGLKFFIQTSDPLLQRLPWQVWAFLVQTYPDVEVILSSDYRPSVVRLKSPVRLLAIEGDTTGTKARLDLTAIESIPGIQITQLQQPTQAALRDCLWDQSWDILLFMGHSRSADRTGEIQLNPTETLSLDELHEVLQYSVENGLQLAIVNSCDGVGIAAKLADLKIPYTIAMREAIPDVIAQTFLQTFLKTFSQGKSLHQSVHLARRKLQERQGQFPCASWLPVIYQNPAAPEMRYPKPITIGRWWQYFVFGLLALGLAVFLGFWSNANRSIAQIYDQRTSLGEDLLGNYDSPAYSAADRAHLQAGLAAVQAAQTPNITPRLTRSAAQAQYRQAAQQFQAFPPTHERPEISIYANNAAIRASDTPVLARIAASVPIGGNNPETAEEMLRGIAQAQQEQIQNGHPIEVMIIADGNGTDAEGHELIPLLAPHVIQDDQIKAVIGPNASDAAKSAATFYARAKLLMVTPTAFVSELNGRGQYTYRMMPSRSEITQPLVEYVNRRIRPGGITAICADGRSPDNNNLAAAFSEPLKVTDQIQPCLGEVTIAEIADRLNKPQTQAILLAPHIERMEYALEVATVARASDLLLLGTPTFFSEHILNNAAAAQSGNGLVFYAPWSPAAAQRRQTQQFEPTWQHHVTWRTASSYDAFNLIAKGFVQEYAQPQHETTRNGLAQFFQTCNTTSCHDGITGNIQFSNGDRVNNLGAAELLEIKQDPQGNWRFLPVSSPEVT
jgi:branched-chain amino acid transport system substrate-binding protein